MVLLLSTQFFLSLRDLVIIGNLAFYNLISGDLPEGDYVNVSGKDRLPLYTFYGHRCVHF